MIKNIKDYISYNKQTGEFFWIKIPSPRNNIKKPIGTKTKKGYLTARFNYKHYSLHRLAWFYEFGKWPKNQIDHINGTKTDNRISNLRDVTNIENCQNLKIHRSGRLFGCHYHKSAKRWCAQIKKNGKRHYIGLFNTQKEAHDAYLNKYKELLAIKIK